MMVVMTLTEPSRDELIINTIASSHHVWPVIHGLAVNMSSVVPSGG